MSTAKNNNSNCIGIYNMVSYIRKQTIPNLILAGYHGKIPVIVTDLSFSEIRLPPGYQYISDDYGERITNKDTSNSNTFEEIKIIRINNNLF